MKIRSPKKGYGFDSKQKYREDVWNFFKKNITVENPKILFFPSKEGFEIPLALSLGFKQENLIAIDGNPAVIAASKWRKDYPRVKFYGGVLSSVMPRIEKDGIKFDGANLDFCNNLSQELITEFNSFVCSEVLSDQCFISLTMMNGRESKAVNVLADLFTEFASKSENVGNIGKSFLFKNKRLLTIILNSVRFQKDRYTRCIGENDYMSGMIKMSYGFVEVASGKWLKNEVESYYVNCVLWIEEYITRESEKLIRLIDDKSKNLTQLARSRCLINEGFREILNTEFEFLYKINDLYGMNVKYPRDPTWSRNLCGIKDDRFLSGRKRIFKRLMDGISYEKYEVIREICHDIYKSDSAINRRARQALMV